MKGESIAEFHLKDCPCYQCEEGKTKPCEISKLEISNNLPEDQKKLVEAWLKMRAVDKMQNSGCPCEKKSDDFQ